MSSTECSPHAGSFADGTPENSSIHSQKNITKERVVTEKSSHVVSGTEVVRA